jgi:hypothetical protein
MYSGEYDACDVTLSVYPPRASEVGKRWAGVPGVMGSIPTVVRHIFQACPMWIYTQSNITSIILIYYQNILISRIVN